MLRISVSLVLLCLSSTALAQPRLRRVLELPSVSSSGGTFLVVGELEEPPEGPVHVVRRDHHISDSTESPTITHARHFEVVLGPAARGDLAGVLLPCRPRSVRRHRTVWIRDVLHGDHGWRRAVEASPQGDCRSLALPISAVFLTDGNLSGVTVARASEDEGVRRLVSQILGVPQVSVFDGLGVGVHVVRYAENNRWWFARVDASGTALRFNDEAVVMASRVGYGGPVAICVSGNSFLIDRVSGPGDSNYRLLSLGRCGGRFDDP